MNDIEKRINKMIKKSEVILNAGKQTNEEWFCGLSTEEKAEFLNTIIRVGPYEEEPKSFWKSLHGNGNDVKGIVEWLMEKHTE